LSASGASIKDVVHCALTPNEWAAFTGPTADAALRDGCLEIWRVYVMPRFEARYGVVVRGLP
jgi:hypothetical protein